MKTLLTATLLAACAAKKAPPRAPLEVKIVAPIPREALFCYGILEIPTPPDTIKLDFDDDDIIRRTTVNIRQYNEMVEFARLLSQWSSNVSSCLSDLTSSGVH